MGNATVGLRHMTKRASDPLWPDARDAGLLNASMDYRPAALRSLAAMSVFSQVNSGSLRPKWPYAAVFW